MWKLENTMINRVKKHFENRGGEGEFTKYFENFPEPIKIEINSLSNFDVNNEIPIIASYLINDYFILLTNTKLYWIDQNEKVNHIHLQDIESVNIDLKARDRSNKMFKGFTITTNSNNISHVNAEPGKPIYGIINVISLICRLKK